MRQLSRIKQFFCQSSFFIFRKFYALVGVIAKKGVLSSGRKKHRNPESSEGQASFLKSMPLGFGKQCLFLLIINKTF
jgi:hypothetical protein